MRRNLAYLDIWCRWTKNGYRWIPGDLLRSKDALGGTPNTDEGASQGAIGRPVVLRCSGRVESEWQCDTYRRNPETGKCAHWKRGLCLGMG